MIITFLFFPALKSTAQNLFNVRAEFPSNYGTTTGIEVGDIDGDGKPDIAVVGGIGVAIYRNTHSSGTISTSSFAPKVEFATQYGCNKVRLGDLDGDGKIDMALTSSNNRLYIFRNTSTVGSISFAARIDITTPGDPQVGTGQPYGLALGDLDGDGMKEVVIANTNPVMGYDGTVSIYHNTSTIGSISLANPVTLDALEYAWDVAISDVDVDGKPDVVITETRTYIRVSVFRNISSVGSIAMENRVDYLTYPSPNQYTPRTVVPADIDGDSKPDFVIGNFESSSISILRNTSTPGTIDANSFTEPVVFNIRGSVGSDTYIHHIAAADLDNDGKKEVIAVKDPHYLMTVLPNTATVGEINSSTFAPMQDYFTGCTSSPTAVAAADFDSDGLGEVVVYNSNNGYLAVYDYDPSTSISEPLVTVPNGGEVWQVSSTHTISWSSLNIANVKIEYSTDAGTTWITIITSTNACQGSYSWIVPNTPTTQALVRITDVTNSSVTDVSDALFTISALPPPTPTVTLLTPNGGEIWKVSSTQTITWTSVNVSNVMLEYSTDNGTFWTTIIASVPASSGAYSWNIPNTPTVLALVRISDVSDALVNDVSDAVFTISQPWQSVSSGTNHHLNDVSFVNESVGWAVGDGSTIIKTIDGGLTWIDQSGNSGVPSNKQFTGVSFVDENTGWVVGTGGSSGTFLFTNDGGVTWTTQATIAQYKPNDISFADDTHGWVVGDDGKIYSTTNGGLSWPEPPIIPMPKHLNGVSFIKDEVPYVGYAVGQDGTILKYSSGSWSQQSNSNTNTLNDLSFVDEDNGWVVGNNGTILATQDGGLNWNAQTSGTTSHLNGVSFISTTLGWAVGNNGTLLRFDLSLLGLKLSAGWKSVPSGTTDDLSVIVLQHGNLAWAMGDSGTVIRYNPSTLILTSPNGGETFTVGTNESITWTTSDNISNITIEYSIDDGANWSTLVSSIPASPASYEWTVNADTTGTALIRITDAADPLTFDISNGIFNIAIDTTLQSYAFTIRQRWNIISLSYSVPNDSANVLFPTKISEAFTFTPSGYESSERLERLKGYWMKFTSDTTLTINGRLVLSDSVSVTSGWNMLGSLSVPLDVAAITSGNPGLVTSQFFGYDAGYEVSETLLPGKGYWVKVNEDANLILSAVATSAVNRITIMPISELPPPSPEGDGRFDTSIIPSEFVLEQNYPNPFNPVSVINYHLPVNSYVTVKVYDMLGQEIATLADEMQGAGFKSVRFDGTGLTSGIYIYRLTAKEITGSATFTDVRKLVLLK
jgi:hypothetical protein